MAKKNKNKSEKMITEWAESMDTKLSNEFFACFNRKPQSDDRMMVVDGPFEMLALGLEQEDGMLQIFTFVKGTDVHPVTDFGFAKCMYSPVREEFYEDVQ